ncbi:MAG: hypothetical protein GF344_01785 [Chitinivibrionales bacterium]|nr:hypothetical protein [Chitinivibrionales bacterium]MBD3355824.1 hypothetical protein [Chitinivibrionales bacterium]
MGKTIMLKHEGELRIEALCRAMRASRHILHYSLLKMLMPFLLILVGTAYTQDSLLVIHPEGLNCREVVEGLRRGLEGEYPLSFLIATDSTDRLDVAAAIKRSNSRLVVCIGNEATALLGDYQDIIGPDKPIVPSVHLMGAFIWSQVKDMRNASAIHYEVPFAKVAGLFTRTVGMKVKNLGVLYRPIAGYFVEECAKKAKEVGINIIDIPLPEAPEKALLALDMELKAKLMVDRVDALWIPNDFVIVNKRSLDDVWKSNLRRNRVPVFVGVETLLQPNLKFGTFAALPIQSKLGEQAAGIIFEIVKNNWRVPDGSRIVFPADIETVINVPQALKKFKITENALTEVDRWIMD